jgi:hypothetical protein
VPLELPLAELFALAAAPDALLLFELLSLASTSD